MNASNGPRPPFEPGLRAHLASFVPSLEGYERLAQDAIAYANRGQWLVGLDCEIGTASVVTIVEEMQLGDFLAPNLDPWAEL